MGVVPQSDPAHPLLPTLAAMLTVLLWASGFVAIGHIGRELSPGALTLGRLLVGSLVLGGFSLTRRTAWPAGRPWLDAQPATSRRRHAFNTWAYALVRTGAGRLGATSYLVPPVTILLSWALLGETSATRAFAGGALCLAGFP